MSAELPLDELREAAERAVLIAAGADAGLFRAMGESALTAGELADRLGFDRRAAEIVLDALADIDVLTVEQDRYRLTGPAHALLADEAAAGYVGGALPLWLRNLRAHARLPEVLREGGPLADTEERKPGGDIARFMAAMASRDRGQVEATVERALARRPRASTALDLGGGPGVYARAFARRGLEVTLMDRAEVIDHVADAYGLAGEGNIRLVPGDFIVDPLPEGPFDLVLMSNITHMFGPDANRMLFDKARHVLVPRGVIAVGDFVRGRSDRAARFAVTMLLRREEGDTYTEARYAEWLREAGFDEVAVDDVTAATQLITALAP